MTLRYVMPIAGTILLALNSTSGAGANLLPPPAPAPAAAAVVVAVVAKTPIVALGTATRPPKLRFAPGNPGLRPPLDAPDAPLLQAADGRILLSIPVAKSSGEPVLINLAGAVEAVDAEVVDGELVFSGLDMSRWTEMLTSVTDSYAGWDMVSASADDEASASAVEIVTSRAAERPLPEVARLAVIARIANRDFAAGVTSAWQPIGGASLVTAKQLTIGGKTFRSPAKRPGTFLIARPAAVGATGGIEQQISVRDGEQINFSVLFASPNRAAGDEISVDLVRDGTELPLYMASGLQAHEPGWQSVSFTVPPGAAGVYRLRLTLSGASPNSAQLPTVGFLVAAEARATELERGSPSGMQ